MKKYIFRSTQKNVKHGKGTVGATVAGGGSMASVHHSKVHEHR